MTATVARNKPKANPTKPAEVTTLATVHAMTSEPKSAVVTTEKIDLFKAISTLKDELKKLDEEYHAKRSAMVEKMRDYQSQVNEFFADIEELNGESTAKKNAKNGPLDKEKAVAWLKDILSDSEVEFDALSRHFKKKFGEDRRLVPKHYADIFTIEKGYAKLLPTK